MAFISVIMVGYNAAAYLPKALSCLLTQKYHDYEFIFIDNGSRDNTADIAKTFKESHPEIDMRLGYIEVNTGLPNGRNLGLSMASGRYVMFHDVDDWMDPDCLEVLAHTANLSHAERIIQQIRIVDNSGKELEQIRYPENASRWSKYYLQGDLFSREVITKKKLYFATDAFYDDFFFTSIFSSVSKSVIFINETHYNMCMHEHSLTHKVGVKIGHYASCLSTTFECTRGIGDIITEEHEKNLYEYSCIQFYYYLVFHSVEMKWFHKIAEYVELNRVMKKYYPSYLGNKNVKLYAPNGCKGHFKRNVWICIMAEKMDKLLRFPFVMAFVLILYHIALRFGLYKYKA